jgi:Fur family ferric uptake transcriptional regulator
MPHSPRSRRLEFTDIDDVAAALREHGGRLSAPRRVVLEALFVADGPVSADYIASGLGGRTAPLDLTSVYRALEQLEELGVARHVHIGHGPGLYALTRAHEREYIVCERCSRVTSVDAARLDPLRERIKEEFGYEARFSHFPIIGLCASCAREARSPSKRGGRMSHEHSHEHPHTHEHSHGDEAHSHAHTAHDHEHTEHEHEHSHGDYVHSHSHVHEKGLEEDHEHSH